MPVKEASTMSRAAPSVRSSGALLLLAAILAAGAGLPTGGTSRRAPAGPSYLFLSANTDDHLSLTEASQRLHSPAQKLSHHLVSEILRELRVRSARVNDAVGDWSEGVENSLVVVLPTAEPAALRCAAAWFGLLAQQKAVLAFYADPAGGDVLTTLELPGVDLATLRRLLDHHGIHDRTLVPHAHGSGVLVVDAGGRLSEPLDNLARQLGGRLRRQAGRCESLAGPTRVQARQRYHEVLRAYHAARR
jgi:hypothetical protein